MVNETNIVSYYRDLLIKPIPANTSSIYQCVLTGWLHDLGNHLGIDSMRLYLYDDKSNKVLIDQIFGDKDYWKDVDITRLRKEKAKYRELFFVKIRNIRENGQSLVLGYLAFHTEQDVTKDLMLSLEVLCMLYGNYIVKRRITGQSNRMKKILPESYMVAASEGLPGTKIQKLLDCLHRLAGFNYGIFCTVYGYSFSAEYIANNKVCTYLRKHSLWQVPTSFIERLAKEPKDYWCQLSDIPQEIVKFVLFNDKRNPESFKLQLYPIYVDHELVGLWMFVFSKNSLYQDFSSTSISILEGTFPLLKDSYRYLFQRRFKAMIINPIFQNRDTRVNQDSVFVIMPFSKDWSKDIWEQVLKPAVQEIGMTPVRADDLYGQNIMEDVWESILKAAIIICDTTDRNPNVFYELGIAHTLGKKVLLLTQDIDDIPFDLRALRHIEYQYSIPGANQLKEKVKKSIKETLSSK